MFLKIRSVFILSDPLQAVLVSTLEAEVGDCKLEQRADRALTR